MSNEIIEAAELNELAMYRDVRSELARIEAENEQVVFDYVKDEKAVRSHIHSLRGVKGNIESERKRLKADALEFGRKVDGAAKEMTARVERMIAIHKEPLDAIAQREADRVAAIAQAIEAITAPGLTPMNNAADVAAGIATVEAITIDADTYQERMAEATKLKADVLATMRATHAELVKREAEAAELDRLRKEAAERERVEREQRIAKEAAEAARKQAEAEAAKREREIEERVAREKAEAEKAAAKSKQDEQDRIERAERARKSAEEAAAKREAELVERAAREKREAEAAAVRAKEDADRRVREERERIEREAEARKQAEERAEAARKAEQAKREANQRHTAKVKATAAAALVDLLGDELATATIEHIASGNVPGVRISF